MPTVISISSHVGVGCIGNSAATFAYARSGINVIPVTTVMMAHHPGHGPVHRQVTSARDLGKVLDDIAHHKPLTTVDAIATGYFADRDQIAVVSDFIKNANRENAKIRYCCDPIFGDAGSLYVDEAVALAIKNELVPLADLITPNLFEFSWLSKLELSQLDASDTVNFGEIARNLFKNVLVTSSKSTHEGDVVTTFINKEKQFDYSLKRIEKLPHGTGDLIAALFFSQLLLGKQAGAAMQISHKILETVLHETTRLDRSELALIEAQSIFDSLIDTQNTRKPEF